MTYELPDVDFDVKDREAAAAIFETRVIASQMDQKNNLVKHNSGLYFQNIPVDPITGLAAFPYDIAEQLGYYKIDMIPYHIYNGVKNEKHLIQLLAVAEGDKFPWQWFQEDRFYTNSDPQMQITQLAKHKYLCEKYPPKSVNDLATLIALIRPRKKYLIGQDWDLIKQVVWEKIEDEDGYFFKKSHAVAFALAILVHMQLLDKELKG